MTLGNNARSAYLIGSVVISIAVAGYFIGLQSPGNQRATRASTAYPGYEQNSNVRDAKGKFQERHSERSNERSVKGNYAIEPEVTPATDYAQMHHLTHARGKQWRTTLDWLATNAKRKEVSIPLPEIKITPAEKSFALARRAKNRAFSGAPPTVPHSVSQTSARACIACHGEGLKSETLRISKMSHQFLSNCTQCHVESNPEHMQSIDFGETSFVGLPESTSGHRAFDGAPPQVPHSVWMRADCSSCHGFTGAQGIRSTHPWRTSCLQCHALTSKLDQSEFETDVKFLNPPLIEPNNFNQHGPIK